MFLYGGNGMYKRLIALLLAFVLGFQIQAQAADIKVSTTNTQVSAEKIKNMMDFIMENYAGEDITEEELYDAAIKGMFDRLDRYSDVYTDEEYKKLMQGVSGNYSGIGSYIKSENKYITITKPMAGSPAEKAGLKPGDIIIKVDGEDIKTYIFDNQVKMIKGPSGSKVVLTIKRGEEVKEYEVIRGNIQVNAVNYKRLKEVLPDTELAKADRIGYIDIDSFNATVARDFGKAIAQAQADGMKGIILDVRDNSGGYLDQVVKMCQMIVPEGNILITRSKKGEEEFYKSELKEKPFQFILLVNNGSASASEIFASAIKESRAGILIGERTYGKGVVQMIYSSLDSRFKMTTKEYFSRNDNRINGIGVEPHVEMIVPGYISENNKRLKVDDENEIVQEVEDILLYLGLIEKADMIYDDKTSLAIALFQKENGLVSDGVTDFDTMTKLNTAIYTFKSENDQLLKMGAKVLNGIMY